MISEKQIYAKGKRSIIYRTRYKGKQAIIKHQDEKTGSQHVTHREAYWLRKLNTKGIGPTLYQENKDEVIMQYIEGPTLPEWTKKATKIQILNILQDILDQCYTMDSLKITKEEMHNPYKHVIIKKNKAYLIDFERAKIHLKPKNVTQFCQYLTTGNYGKLLQEKGITFNKEKMITTLEDYKKNLKKHIILKELL